MILKALITKIIAALLIIIILMIAVYRFQRNQNDPIKASSINENEKISRTYPEISKSKPKQNAEKLKDTMVILSFKDLSKVYNYKIIDRYYCNNSLNYYDSILRVIKVYNKKDSLIQRIYPNLQMTPWYYYEDKLPLRLSRSFVTGKNANYDDADNYDGEIVIADLNFDGLEDLATPVNSGADNGPHYAFYIQNKNKRFEYNSYLTEHVMWFPEKINDSLMTFTSTVPCTVIGLWYQTFKYDTTMKKWSRIKNYIVDIRTGKRMKPY